jgi:hypothetical protein
MDKIIWEDINKDKSDLLYLLKLIIPVYRVKEMHTKLLEANKLYEMILIDKTEYTKDALLALNNIMMDCANYLSLYGELDDAKLAINLTNKISLKFKNE